MVTTEQLKAFGEVARALLEIRDKRLFRRTHPTFAAYCRDRWQLTDEQIAQVEGMAVAGRTS